MTTTASVSNHFTKKFEEDWNVKKVNAPFGMKSIPLSLFSSLQPFQETAKEVSQILESNNSNEKFNFTFPKDYVQFVQEVGPGTLHNCLIFAPLSSCSPSTTLPSIPFQIDVAFHTKRLHQKFKSPVIVSYEEEEEQPSGAGDLPEGAEFFFEVDQFPPVESRKIFVETAERKKVHSFPLHRLVVFAVDKSRDLLFAWKAPNANEKEPAAEDSGEEDEAPEFPVYVVDDAETAPPPMRVADSFTEFIEECCLGNHLRQNGIKKIKERQPEARSSATFVAPSMPSELELQNNEQDSDDDEDEEDVETDEPKVFRPFAIKA